MTKVKSRFRSIISDQDTVFHDVTDVVVVGTGAAGYAAAITASKGGAKVIQLEKAERVGGTTRKAGGWIWVPNNPFMQAAGMPDSREDFIRYVARLARPNKYGENTPWNGLTQWQYERIGAFYDRGTEALRQLMDWGAIRIQHGVGVPDYYAQLPENTSPEGRCMFPNQLDQPDGPIGSGQDIIDLFDRTARQTGVDIRVRHAVRQVVCDGQGAVVGVVVDTPDGPVAIRARRGVVFASGGFTHNVEMRDNFLSGPVMGGCAAHTNTGDFVAIAQELGADLLNMNYALMSPMVLDVAVENLPTSTGSWRIGGDSMIWVNKYGKRVTDEKAMYHELAQVFHTWDPVRAEFPNLVLVSIWDQGTEDHFTGELIPGYSYEFGNPLIMNRPDRPHVVKADTLPELAEAIQAKLKSFDEATGGFQLDETFVDSLSESIGRFNQLAGTGVDTDFHRGESPMPLFFNGPARPGNEGNPTMYPISANGPYYATLMVSASIDTNGGPRTDNDGRVLDHSGEPIPGIYGAGNCVASPFGKSYPAAGATLGPYFTSGYVAGSAVAVDPQR
jgi:succinate dehydrogenase/fumarate reductase flavoprotein subunit